MRTQKRRRRENKTDYNLRLKLLKSGKPRIVVRRTNKYFIVQAIESNEAKDKVFGGVTSKELLKHGWDKKLAGSLKSIPAGYLTGLLFAKKITKTGKKFIVDLGMARTLSGGRIFSVLKGIVDGGIDINVNKSIFPSQERLEGAHLKEEVKNSIKKVMEKLK